MPQDQAQLSVALIGLGHWGPNLLRSFLTHPRAKVSYAVDVSTARLDLIREKFPDLNLVNSIDAALADDSVQAVVISVPTANHYQVAQKALKAGKHVLVEKPLTDNLKSANELVQLAKEKKLLLMVGHVFLFNEGIQEAKRIIDCGELGEILYIRSIRSNLGPIRTDVNALWDLASHDISIFNYLFGTPPLEVSCKSFHLLGQRQEDVSQGSLLYSGNKVATFLVSWLDPQKTREVTVVGDKRMLVFDDMRPDRPLRIYDKGVKFGATQPYADAFSQYKMYIHAGTVIEPNVNTGEPLKNEVNHFVSAVLDGAPLISSGQFGTEVVAVLEALTGSAHERGTLVKF